MKLSYPILLGLVLLLFSCIEQNTSAIVHSYTQEKDLNSGDTVHVLSKSIWIIFQDKNNDYWFGSNGDGVYRYDGNTILQYKSKDNLLLNTIRGIQEDTAGNIFISSLEGISKFDGRTFTRLAITESNDWKLEPNDLWFSILGKTGEKGPYRYDGRVLHRLHFPKHPMEDDYYKANGKHAWSPYEPYFIYKDSKGHLWFGTAELGVGRYNGSSFQWIYEKHLTMIEGGGSFGIRSILEDKEGKFWFTNTSFRYAFHNKDEMHSEAENLLSYSRERGIENIRSPEGKEMIYFMSAIEDAEGDVWMQTYEQGVWRYDGINTTQYSVLKDGQQIKLFSIYQDKKGILWLGTHEEGVYRFNGKSFEKFTLEY